MRYYSNNAEGMVQSRRDGRIEDGVFVQGDPALPDDPKPNFQFVNANGQQIAQLREGGEVTLAATKQQAASTRTEDTLLSVAGTSPYAAGGGKVQVQEGDTLSTLAQRVYGNRGLWYVLAQANGLSDPDGPLTAGTALNAPSVSVNKNDAGTFRPYNPAEAIGPTSPDLPFIDPPKQGCNIVATLIMVAVTAVVVSFAPELASTLTPYFSGAAIGTGIFAEANLAAAMVASFATGFAGSVASQVVGKAVGVVDHFSLRSAVGSGLTNAMTAGIGAKLGGSTAELIEHEADIGTIAKSAVLTAGAGVVGNRLAGVPGAAFSWKAIAASAVSNIVAAGIGHELDVKAPNLFGDAGSFSNNFANGMIGGIVSVHTRRQFGFNDRIDYGNIAADAFGNALGNAVAGEIKTTRVLKTLTPEQRADFDEMVKNGIPKSEALISAQQKSVPLPDYLMAPDRAIFPESFGDTADQAVTPTIPAAIDGAMLPRLVTTGLGDNVDALFEKSETFRRLYAQARQIEVFDIVRSANPEIVTGVYDGKIILNPDVFRSAEETVRVVSHEIGHVLYKNAMEVLPSLQAEVGTSTHDEYTQRFVDAWLSDEGEGKLIEIQVQKEIGLDTRSQQKDMMDVYDSLMRGDIDRNTARQRMSDKMRRITPNHMAVDYETYYARKAEKNWDLFLDTTIKDELPRLEKMFKDRAGIIEAARRNIESRGSQKIEYIAPDGQKSSRSIQQLQAEIQQIQAKMRALQAQIGLSPKK